MLEISEYSQLLFGLVALACPIPSIPIIAAMVADRSSSEKTRVALTASLTFIIALIIFNLIGNNLLRFLGITLSSFQIAGGILLLLMALSMMQSSSGNPSGIDQDDDTQRRAIGIVPIGIPMLAGPGAMSTVIIFSEQNPSVGNDIAISIVIAVVGLMIFVTLLQAQNIARLIGKTGMVIFNRVMGLIIAAVGVEFMVSGLAVIFPGLLG